MSLYAEYIKEKLDDNCMETELGFATYRYLNDNKVYIIDIYVKPEYRKSKIASDLADLIAQEAKEKGCKEMLGTVIPSAKGSTNSLKVLLGYGMTLVSSDKDLIIFKKELI